MSVSLSCHASMIRIFIVDDHTILRSGLRLMMADQTDLQVVGEASNGTELLDQLAVRPADLVLLDLNMPGMNGAETTRRLRQEHPGVHVLVLSMTSTVEQIVEMFEAGALGYLLKTACLDEMMYAIRTVAQGEQFLCSELGLTALRKNMNAAVVPEPFSPEEEVESVPTLTLTGRETEVLQLIAEGLTNQEMADRLFTSRRTVETHRQNLIAKTHAKNTAALIKLAISQGLIR